MTHILIVDDKPENLYYLRALFSGSGYTVEEARHGAEALVVARSHPPDVIISDLLMPVMDGYTLLRYWKADAELQRIPFVVYTAPTRRRKTRALRWTWGPMPSFSSPASRTCCSSRWKPCGRAAFRRPGWRAAIHGATK